MPPVIDENKMQTGGGLLLKKVLAIFQEFAERQKETDRLFRENAERQKEADRQTKKTADRLNKENAERLKETNRLFGETVERLKENDRLNKENADQLFNENSKRQIETEQETMQNTERLDKQFGKLCNRFSEMVDYQVVPNMISKFKDFGFVFENAHQQTIIRDKTNNISMETDITLENDDKVMVVEVKIKPTIEDIIEHIGRMEKVKAYAELRGDRRKYLGAVAGMAFDQEAKTLAMKKGFYVIEPSSETFIITAPEGDNSSSTK
jgi:hypothetical protein